LRFLNGLSGGAVNASEITTVIIRATHTAIDLMGIALMFEIFSE